MICQMKKKIPTSPLKLRLIETYESYHSMNVDYLHDNLNSATSLASDYQLNWLNQTDGTSNGWRPFEYLRLHLWDVVISVDPGVIIWDFKNDFSKHCEGLDTGYE